MRIAKIWKNDYPWDVRVEKICNSLIDAGHEVHLVCSNVKKQKVRDNINGLHVHRLPALRNDVLNRIFLAPVFFNPLWIYKLFKVVKNEKIEVIMIRDLPLVLTGIMIGKIYKIPVIFDMAENYSAMWGDIVDRSGLKFYNYLLKNPFIAEFLEKYVVKRVDKIIVVVEESKDRILKQGIPSNKLSIVGNTPEFKTLNNNFIATDQRFKKNKFKLVYTGFVDKGRGVDTVIKSLPILKKKINNIYFIIVGNGSYLNHLKKIAKEIGVEKYVHFTGWVEYSQVQEYINQSDVCVIPHNVSKQMNTTIPNKLFDYMASKKPVIGSNAAPIKRIIEENNCGVVFLSKNVKSFVEKVMELEDISARSLMGENGYMAVKSKYNWSKDSQALIEVFRELQVNKALN